MIVTAPAASAASAPTSRARLIAVLQAADRPLRVDELCRALFLSPNAVRYQLARLVAGGEVRVVPLPPHGPGRPALAYRTVPRGAADEAAAVARALSLLAELGLQPELRVDGTAIVLHVAARPALAPLPVPPTAVPSPQELP